MLKLSVTTFTYAISCAHYIQKLIIQSQNLMTINDVKQMTNAYFIPAVTNSPQYPSPSASGSFGKGFLIGAGGDYHIAPRCRRQGYQCVYGLWHCAKLQAAQCRRRNIILYLASF